MLNDDIWKAYSHGMATALQEGGIYLSSMLLRSYRELGLQHEEAMLLLQLMAYNQAEYNEFPTLEQLAGRMGTTTAEISGMLSKLIKEQFLTIEDYVDSITGMQSERYNYSGWLLKAAGWASSQQRESKKAEKRLAAARQPRTEISDLFSVFEQELGRLLSPMECETISAWLDEDQYSDELIRFALKEAVFAGKLSLRYIDRILIDWSRNRVTNADEARAHAQKFRAGRS